MSGPKRADVKAALNVAQQAQRRGSEMLAASRKGVLKAACARATVSIDAASRRREALDRRVAGLAHDVVRLAAPLVQEAMDASRTAAKLRTEAQGRLQSARAQEQHAADHERTARGQFDEAEAEYRRAAKALADAGAHYLHQEMQWAQRARKLFEAAAATLQQAGSALERARQAAEEAEALAGDADRVAGQAMRGLDQAQELAKAGLEAERQAKRIAEKRVREVTLENQAARAAVERALALSIEDHQPGQGARLRAVLQRSTDLLVEGEIERASELSGRLRAEAERIAGEVAAAQHAREAETERAGIRLDQLEAAIAAAASSDLAPWSDPEEIEAAPRRLLDRARSTLHAGQPGAAEQGAAEGQAALDAALEAAAARLSAHDRRSHVGEAVMDALAELGFEVSYEPGDRTEPLRISALTPDENGRGDFDLEIPLDGELDFEVRADAGDSSCVAAVGALRERLAARGVSWETTDWGHADPSTPGQLGEKTTIGTTQVKVKQRL